MADELTEIKKKFGTLNEYSIQLNRWFLKPIGAWPESSSTTKREKIVSQILIIICWSIALFTIIPGVLRVIFVNEDLYVKLQALGPVSHSFVGGFNYAALLLRSVEIRHCMDHIQADWKIITRTTDQRIMLKNAKIARSIAGFTAAFMHSGVFSTCIVLGVLKHTVVVGNETMLVHTLPCPPYKIPVDTNPTHDIVLATQFFSGFIFSSSVVAAFSLATTFAHHALGQLNIIGIWINEFVNRPRDQYKNTKNGISIIGIIVEHHLRVLSFIARIEHVMSPIYFMEMFHCSMALCMTSYFILMEWSGHNTQTITGNIMVIVSMTFNIFLICYIGEVLTEQCRKIGDVVYMTNWYELPDKDILNLIMIISRSSMEVKLTAGKLITMSIYTFGSIVKTAFAYMNILRQTTIM